MMAAGLVGGPVFEGPGALVGLVVLFAGSAVVAFLIGGLNPATLFARLLGKDLRGSGSGNPGATNAGRVLGVKWGVVVGVLDVAKGYLPTWLTLHFAGSTVAVIVGLAVVAGHMFSPFLRGKGGKGVATALGAMLALAPWYALIAVVTFAIGILVFRITGVGSMLTCAVLVVTGILGALGALGSALGRQHPGWVALVGALVLWRHRVNLKAWVRTLRSR
jgi:glycerol-3-phosphate acyltransferase PlsY